MIYNIKTTVLRGSACKVFVDGEEVPEVFYLDRRRRILRKFRQNEDGEVYYDFVAQEVAQETIYIHHRSEIELMWFGKRERGSNDQSMQVRGPSRTDSRTRRRINP